MRMERAAALGIFLALAAAAGAQGSFLPWVDGGPHIGVEAIVGTPSAQGDIFRKAFVGASLRYIASPTFEISLDYAFMDLEYYYPQSPSGPWIGPVQWSSVPDRFAGLKDSWIFYHTKHFISPVVWYIAPLEEYGLPLALRLGAGPAISFIVPSAAAQYYPGLSDAFTEFRSSFKAYLGLSLRLGLEYRPWRYAHLGLEYLFIVDSISSLAGDISRDGFGYFDRAGNLMLVAGVRI
jgi:hypothetical protein